MPGAVTELYHLLSDKPLERCLHDTQHHARTALEGIAFTGDESASIRAFSVYIASIDLDTPAGNAHILRQAKFDWCRIGIEQQQVGIVSYPAASFVVLLYGISM